METIERHVSPDGTLQLVVCQDHGDISLGFDGFQWHTHADILAALSGLSEGDAVRRFVDELLQDRTIIAVVRVAGEIRDVWITDDPKAECRYKSEDELIEFRYWSGRTLGQV